MSKTVRDYAGEHLDLPEGYIDVTPLDSGVVEVCLTLYPPYLEFFSPSEMDTLNMTKLGNYYSADDGGMEWFDSSLTVGIEVSGTWPWGFALEELMRKSGRLVEDLRTGEFVDVVRGFLYADI